MNFFSKLLLSISLISYGLVTSNAVAKIDNYEAALQAYYENDIDSAFIHLKNALRENESNLPAKLLLSEVLIKKKLYSQAEQELNDALLEGADFNLIVEPLGRVLLFQGKFNLVVQLADEKGLHNKGQLLFNLIKAKAYTGLSNTERSEEIYNTVLTNHPNNVEAMIELAAINIGKDEIEEAHALLKKAEALAPNSSRLWQVKGVLARNMGQEQESLIFYSKASELEPSNAAILRAMASSHINLQHPEKAQTLVDEILSVNPKDLQAQLMKSNILKSLDKQQLSNEILIKLTNQLSSIDESYMLSQPLLLLIDAMSSYGQSNWLQAQKKLQIYINQGLENDDMSAVVLLADVYVKLAQPDMALKLLASYESPIIKNKDYALILAGLYLQFKQNFKADYVLQKLQHTYPDDEDVLILSAKLLSNTGQEKAALLLLESSKSQSSQKINHSLAVTALRVGALNKALEYTGALISISPETVEYQLLYVQALLQVGRFDDAKSLIVGLYKKYPKNKQVTFSFALLQFNLENISKAKTLLNQLVKESPEDGESWFILAQIEYDLGNVNEAVAILERQTKNEAHRQKALYKLAAVHYAEKAYDKSLSVINVLLQKSRLDTKAIFIKAKNLIASNQLKGAKHQLDILLGLWSDDARNLLKLSQLQLRIDDISAAEKSLEMAYGMAPNALPIIIDLIKIKIRQSNLSEAALLLSKAQNSGYKNNLYLIILQGDIELGNNNIQSAFIHYSSVLKKDEGNVIALLKLSQISQSVALSEKLINQLGSIVKNKPELVLQRHIFADHLFEHKKYQQAKFQYQRLLTLDIPAEKIALALNNLSLIYLNEAEYKFAVETAKQAHKILPSPAIVDTLGWSLVLSSEVEQGLSYLRQAFSMVSTNPEIQYHIAYSLVKLNRKVEAKIMLTDILKQPGTFADYKLAEQLLNSL
ncbi:MAG: tetratricopeptide repeat protein [Colwellia sp.]|nr:tetratricopeptide repeat protein [Colwellia sp.]